MTISCGRISGGFPVLTVGLIPAVNAEKPKQDPPGTLLGHQLHDEVIDLAIATSTSLKRPIEALKGNGVRPNAPLRVSHGDTQLAFVSQI